jgi:hypothetical protein
MNLVAHCAATEQLPFALSGGIGQPLDLMWFRGHRQHAGALPFGVEPQRLNVGLHAVEVLLAHRFERVNLVGPACFSIGPTVRQARVDKATVAT